MPEDGSKGEGYEVRGTRRPQVVRSRLPWPARSVIQRGPRPDRQRARRRPQAARSLGRLGHPPERRLRGRADRLRALPPAQRARRRCIVVAPSLVPARPGDRVKTEPPRHGQARPSAQERRPHGGLVPRRDRRGAARISSGPRRRQGRPTAGSRHRLSKFLLRGRSTRGRGPGWSRAHDAWLERITFSQSADQVVLDDYRSVARAAAERVKRLEAALRRVATTGAQLSSSPRSRRSAESASCPQ